MLWHLVPKPDILQKFAEWWQCLAQHMITEANVSCLPFSKAAVGHLPCYFRCTEQWCTAQQMKGNTVTLQAVPSEQDEKPPWPDTCAGYPTTQQLSQPASTHILDSYLR